MLFQQAGYLPPIKLVLHEVFIHEQSNLKKITVSKVKKRKYKNSFFISSNTIIDRLLNNLHAGVTNINKGNIGRVSLR